MAKGGTGGSVGGGSASGGGSRGGAGGFGGGRAGGSFGASRGGVGVLGGRSSGSKFAGGYGGSREGGSFAVGPGKMGMGKSSGFEQGLALSRAAGKIEAGSKGAKAAKLDTKFTVFSDGRTPATKNIADKMTSIGRGRTEAPSGRDTSRVIKMDVMPHQKTEPLSAIQILALPEFRPQAQPRTDTTVRQQRILGELKAIGRQGKVNIQPTLSPEIGTVQTGPRLSSPEQAKPNININAKARTPENPFLSRAENRLSHADRIKSITGELEGIDKKLRADAKPRQAGEVIVGPIKGLEVMDQKVRSQEELVSGRKTGTEASNTVKKDTRAVGSLLEALKKKTKIRNTARIVSGRLQAQKVDIQKSGNAAKPDSGASITYLAALNVKELKKKHGTDADEQVNGQASLSENISVKSRLLRAKVVSLLKRTEKPAVSAAPSSVTPEPLRITRNDQTADVIELRQTATQLSTEFASQTANPSDRAQAIATIRALNQRAASVSATVVNTEQAVTARTGQPVEMNNVNSDVPNILIIRPTSKSVDQSALAVRIREGVNAIYAAAETGDPDEYVSGYAAASFIDLYTSEATSEAIKESKLDIADGSIEPTLNNIRQAGAIQIRRAPEAVTRIARLTPPASDRSGESISKTDYDRVFGRGEHIIYQAA